MQNSLLLNGTVRHSCCGRPLREAANTPQEAPLAIKPAGVVTAAPAGSCVKEKTFEVLAAIVIEGAVDNFSERL